MMCSCCGRECEQITKHHLIPRTRHQNKKAKKDFKDRFAETIVVCPACHKQIHATFSEKELERQYHALDLIMAHPAMAKFIEWIRKRPEHLRIGARRS